MADLTAQRTLVKSPPELWSELSEVESLAKHLGELGEIRITKVEPESTVAWEGEEVSGTVELEQSGWGTKVTFRATVPEPGPAIESEAIAPEPAADPEPSPEPVAVESELVEPERAPEPESEPVAIEPPAAAVESESPVEAKQGFFARWLFRRRQPLPEPVAPREPEPVASQHKSPPAQEPVALEAEPEPAEPPVVESASKPEPVAAAPDPPAKPAPEPVATADAERVQRVLDGTLEALGQAHHRPFSRG
jgi:hypothetical protein